MLTPLSIVTTGSVVSDTSPWTVLEGGERAETERMPVPGGWLYRTSTWAKILDTAENPKAPTFLLLAQQVTFVPDDNVDRNGKTSGTRTAKRQAAQAGKNT